MPASDAVDRYNRELALSLAVATHPGEELVGVVLHTATRYLGWLRQPTIPATLTLSTGTPISK